MELLRAHLFYLLLSFFLTSAPSHEKAFPLSQDLNILLSFKASSDLSNPYLETWEGTDPCSGSWLGVKCKQESVVIINLDNASLVGSITPLLQLSELRALSLRMNALSGSLPHLTSLTHPKLKHLFLSYNQFSGTLSITHPTLLSLRLEHNGFSGGLQDLRLPLAMDFNLSANNLTGEISPSLSKFPISSFGGNQALCGLPLPSCRETTSLASNCSIIGRAKLGDTTTVLAISIGNIVVILIALAFVIAIYLWFRKKMNAMLRLQSTVVLHEELGSVHSLSQEKKRDVELVRFEGGERLRLDFLLKSSAEVLGKGVYGSTYKAVLDDGMLVAVKRLTAVRLASQSKGFFDKKMRQIGSLTHRNLVCLRAYHSSEEEKLLVYDYMPNGSLQSLLLHGSNGRRQISIGLNWSSIMQVLEGAAHGLNFIHTSPARSPLIHGNIKPSNILIDGEGNGRVSEWGLMWLADNIRQSCSYNSSTVMHGTTTAGGDGHPSNWCSSYRAPELLTGRGKASQETDVYGYGMVLLEVVTCKEIDDAEGEKGMMGIIKIGMMCTSESPEDRPKMAQVLMMMREFVKD